MKKNYFLVLALFAGLILNTVAQAQRNCGTMYHLQQQILADPSVATNMDQIEVQTQQWITNNKHNTNSTTAVITIPVVVHVLYNSATLNISDAQVQSQIDVLNEDFRKLNVDVANVPSVFAGLAADCQIQFCLAKRDPNGNATTGIIHKSTTVSSFSSNDNIKRSANGGDDAWNSSLYLNIWVGNLSGGLLGYAQFPGGAAATDGVVILYNAFGRVGTVSAPYNKGRSATHEIGHWLNLRHIWGDANCGNDQVSDTPTQQTSNFGCPSFPHVTCSNGPNGDMWMNYMDYTDDPCMYMFTTGQSSRMSATLNGTRASLITSQGCVPPAVGVCNIPAGLTAGSINTTSATLSWGAVSGATSYNVQYRTNGSGTWTPTTSTTNSKAISGLVASTTYEFQVQTVCSASSSSAFSASATFTTSDVPTCAVPSSLSAGSITATTATLSWGVVSGASSYNVQYRTNGSGAWTATTSTTNSKAISGLVASTTYEFQIQTVCSASSSSAFSSSATFTTSAAQTSCTDIYEPNNSRTAGKTIAVNTDITGLISSSSDNDYYKFTTVAGGTYLKIVLDQLPLDYDLRLINSSGTVLATSQNGGTTSEQIIRNTTSATTYYIRVWGFNSAFSSSSCYHLRVNAGSSAFRTASGEATEGFVNLEKISGIDEFSIFPNPANDQLNLNYFTGSETSMQIAVIDMLGKTIFNQTLNTNEGFNQSSIDLTSLNNGIYFLRVQQNDNTLVKKFVVKH